MVVIEDNLGICTPLCTCAFNESKKIMLDIVTTVKQTTSHVICGIISSFLIMQLLEG